MTENRVWREQRVIRAAAVAWIVLASLAGPLAAKEWARKMFETTSHDFQTMARGAKAEFDFVLQNIYKEDIHIASVRSSCGCTSPEILKPLLQTWEKGAIRCKFNTRSFLGQKTATITVTIDEPYFAEVQLTIRGFVRQDVVLSPGAVEYGEVDAGSVVERTVDVSYAGRDDWSIIDIEKPGPYYEVDVVETERGGGRVGYRMTVRLTKDAPAGALFDQLVIVTNDQNLERIPFTVQGRVLSGVTVSPASLALGTLRPGQRVTKQLVVRSKRPFQVTDVRCDGDCLSFKSPQGAKKLHFIPVTFTAGDEPGHLAMNIYIETDLGKGAVARCLATASVCYPDDSP